MNESLVEDSVSDLTDLDSTASARGKSLSVPALVLQGPTGENLPGVGVDFAGQPVGMIPAIESYVARNDDFNHF